MRIGVNLFALMPQGGGMREYVLQLLPWLVRGSSHSYLLFHGDHGRQPLEALVGQLTTEERVRVGTVEIVVQDEILAHADRFDLLFCPLNGLAPDLLDRPTVATLADVQEQFFPHYFTRRQRINRAVVYPRCARAATLLVTISEFSRQSICQAFGIDSSRVRVTHLAANEQMRHARSHWPADLPTLPDRFVFYPANLYPHKGHELLLRALRHLQSLGLPCAAVLTGHEVSPGIPIQQRIRAHGLEGKVLWLGHVPAEALRHLYERALALCFVSQFEGFGLPLVEAMRCGCPVIATRTASIPEVAGEAALYVEPTAEAIGGAITRLIEDPGLRERLVQRGREQGQGFDVRNLAGRTLEILAEATARFHQAHQPLSRQPISYVVEPLAGGSALAQTLASVARERRAEDELILLDERALAGEVSWPQRARHPIVCYLREGDRLCEQASCAVQTALAAHPRSVAVVGEALAIDPGGTRRRTRFVPDPGGAQLGGPLVPPAAVFWRREYLRAQEHLLHSSSWANSLLVAAGSQALPLFRTLALVDTTFEDRFHPRAGLRDHLRQARLLRRQGLPVPRWPLFRAHGLRCLARARRPLGWLARILPRWIGRPLRSLYWNGLHRLLLER